MAVPLGKMHLIHSFHHVGEAIHGWGDHHGEGLYEYPDADLVLVVKDHDLYALSLRELAKQKVAFKKFDMLDITDILRVFASAWDLEETLR